MAVNVVSLGEFLAPLLLTGLQGLQWQAWLNGDLSGFGLDCMSRRFLPSGTSVVWTNLDAEYVGCGPADLLALSI